MTTFFADTSALVKRYVNEKGSAWAASQFTSPSNVIIIAESTLVEMFSMFERRKRDNTLPASTVGILEREFLAHSKSEYLITPIDSRIVESARILVTKHPLRAFDAIQLASSLYTLSLINETITFACADGLLFTAAQAEGFKVENPNNYP